MAKLAASGNLLLSHGGLLSVEKPRARLATHCLGQALVRTVASLGIAGASAARLAALDGALGNRAAAHRLRLSQFGGELADAGWDLGRSGHVFNLTALYAVRSRSKKKAHPHFAHFETYTRVAQVVAQAGRLRLDRYN